MLEPEEPITEELEEAGSAFKRKHKVFLVAVAQETLDRTRVHGKDILENEHFLADLGREFFVLSVEALENRFLGIEYARTVLEKAFGEETANTLLQKVSKSLKVMPFAFLSKTSSTVSRSRSSCPKCLYSFDALSTPSETGGTGSCSGCRYGFQRHDGRFAQSAERAQFGTQERVNARRPCDKGNQFFPVQTAQRIAVNDNGYTQVAQVARCNLRLLVSNLLLPIYGEGHFEVSVKADIDINKKLRELINYSAEEQGS